jgi:hypothetical protein
MDFIAGNYELKWFTFSSTDFIAMIHDVVERIKKNKYAMMLLSHSSLTSIYGAAKGFEDFLGNTREFVGKRYA